LYKGNEASEYSFTNLFIWSPGDQVEWMEGDGFMLFRTKPQTRTHYLMAFAPEDKTEPALEAAIAAAKADGERFSLHSLPEWYRDRIESRMPGRFAFEREPHHDDYIYNVEDLTSLAGKKYQAKRNHINRFMREYGGRFTYAAYERGMADGCMAIYARWLSTKEESQALRSERESVKRALYHAEELGIEGGVILVDGKPEAFSLGERITEDMAVIHIEKANLDIPELFALINREFASHAFAGMKWINREEDMGDEGMRTAKQSYHPARMVAKYRAVLSENGG
jgi:hypothetical protein